MSNWVNFHYAISLA
jgi:hypothetical protein